MAKERKMSSVAVSNTRGNWTKRITDPQDSGTGRRSHRRYTIELGIRCREIRGDRDVFGKISDISTGGVRFTSSQSQAPGTTVEISIEWPMRLDGTCHLQLKGRGRVLRSDENETAIKIERYEFCTRTAPLCVAAAVGT